MAIYVDGQLKVAIGGHSDQFWRAVSMSVSNYGCFCLHSRNKLFCLTMMFVMLVSLCQGLAFIYHKHHLTCYFRILLTTYRKLLHMLQAATIQ